MDGGSAARYYCDHLCIGRLLTVRAIAVLAVPRPRPPLHLPVGSWSTPCPRRLRRRAFPHRDRKYHLLLHKLPMIYLLHRSASAASTSAMSASGSGSAAMPSRSANVSASHSSGSAAPSSTQGTQNSATHGHAALGVIGLTGFLGLLGFAMV